MKKRFIFDENYIKKYKKKDQLKFIIGGIIALFLIIIIIVIILITKNHQKTNSISSFKLKDSLVIESGSLLPTVQDYFINLKNIDEDNIEIIYPEDFEINYNFDACTPEEIEQINNSSVFNSDNFKCAAKVLKNPNTYGITIKVLDEEKTVNLIVEDTKAPKVEVKDFEMFVGNTYKVEDFITSCLDISGTCKLSFIEENDKEGNIIKYDSYKEPGSYIVKFIAQDEYQNVSDILTAKLTIIATDKNIYNVKFNTDGGNIIDDVLIEDGGVVNEPTTPVKEGYTFLGWYLNNNQYDFSSPIKDNITLKAMWKKIEENNDNPGTSEPSIVRVSSVVLDYKKLVLTVGQSKTVKATVKPNNATYKSVTWSSQDSGIASVNGGVITGVKVGTTYISATADGKTSQVEVVVRDDASACRYGDTNYSSDYILSVNLTQNGCAINPNINPNEAATANDYQSAMNKLLAMGFKLNNNFNHRVINLTKVKNTSGTGLVGYQITIEIKIIDEENPYIVMSAKYIINPDGSRHFITNDIYKNNMKFE